MRLLRHTSGLKKIKKTMCNILKISGKIQNFNFLLIIFIISIFLTSCGRKAPPVPPGTLVPQKITDLSYKCAEKGVELNWTVPQRNNNGSPVNKIDSFLLFKAELSHGDSCKDCPIKFDPSIEIPFNANPENRKKMIYEDRIVNKDKLFIYEVVASKGLFGKSERSNRLIMSWHPPSMPPEKIELKKVDNNNIRISWNAPEKWSDGAQISYPLFYNVYALWYNDEWKRVGVARKETFFTHKEPPKGLQNKYRVTAVLNYKGSIIESEPSEISKLTENDTAAPAPPKGLVATFENGKTDLLWQENSEEDLRGYFIYRVNPDGFIDRLNEKPLLIPRFTDKNIFKDGKYQYYVTAVDNAEPSNQSKPSNRAKIEIFK
jgi:hypothetical protein